jgi:syntenin-1
MSLYPSVEDMNVNKLEQAQAALNHEAVTGTPYVAPQYTSYMGENVSQPALSAESPYSGYTPYQSPAGAVAARTQTTGVLSTAASNYQKAKIHEGVNTLVMFPDAHGKLGFKVKSVSKGIFVQCVIAGLPAAAAGLRFGDQILQINDVNVAGFSSNKAHDLVVENAKKGRVAISVRQRPFERTIVLKKDSTEHLGFEFKKAKITGIRKDSSAARNGLLTDHYFTEVNGQNVVGMKDNDILQIIHQGGDSVTLTIVPESSYNLMIKNLSSKTRSLMDHEIPQL